jgi:hypothetical protein
VTSFGTWGNQQVTAIDKEKWATLDFNQYFNDGGVLSSIDFGAALRRPQARSAVAGRRNPGRHLERAEERRDRQLSQRLRRWHRRHLPAQPLVLHPGRAEGRGDQQLHLAGRQ